MKFTFNKEEITGMGLIFVLVFYSSVNIAIDLVAQNNTNLLSDSM